MKNIFLFGFLLLIVFSFAVIVNGQSYNYLVQLEILKRAKDSLLQRQDEVEEEKKKIEEEEKKNEEELERIRENTKKLKELNEQFKGVGGSVDTGVGGNEWFTVTAPPKTKGCTFLAKKIADNALKYAEEIAKTWFGQNELPEATDDKSLRMAHISTRIYNDGRDIGETMVSGEGDMRVYLQSSIEGVLGTTLNHEIAHVVGVWYGPLPVWGIEAIASSYDDDESKSQREKIMKEVVKSGLKGDWPSLLNLFNAGPVIPRESGIGYSLSESVKDFLLTRGNEKKFTDFLKDGANGDWDSASNKHYGFYSLAALQSQWQNWAKNKYR